MLKDVYFSDIVDGAGKGLGYVSNLTGSGLRNAWKAASGNWMHNKVGSKKLDAGDTALISAIGAMIATMTGIVMIDAGNSADSVIFTSLSVWSGTTSLPLVHSNLRGAYGLSKHNKALALEKKQTLQIERHQTPPKLT